QDLKDERLFTKKFEVFDINWLSDEVLKFPLEVDCQVRYRQKAARAKISKYSESAKTCLVELENSQRAVTSGQSAVFYKEEESLGGGIIK
ncbi:MAG: tRNA 2-thiouridine(34) synthase MnmA, partial [Parcubacteria group bacterium]|nr:tRNA 2-thiouridine(34) synthase MnmA [Parcubacteria group bacterium]